MQRKAYLAIKMHQLLPNAATRLLAGESLLGATNFPTMQFATNFPTMQFAWWENFCLDFSFALSGVVT